MLAGWRGTKKQERIGVMLRASIWLLAAALVQPAAPQSMRAKDLAPGKLLAANPESPDPYFAESVILLVRYNEKGSMGLIVNRPTKVPLARVVKGGEDPLYAGGPVARTGALALIRSGGKPEEADHVFADVYLTASRTLLEKRLAAEPDAVRVYMGYCGWTAGQLQREVELGAWYIFRADAETVFHENPRSVWQRLIRQAEAWIAVNRRAPSY